MKLSQYVSLIALILALYILWQIRQVLLLAFSAVILATVLSQGVQRLQRWQLQRGLAVVLMILVTIALFAIIVAGVVPPFVSQLQQLFQLVPQGVERLENLIDNLELMVPEKFTENLRGFNGILQQLQALDAQMVVERFYLLFSNTLTILLNILLVLVLSIMLMADPQPYQRAFVRLFPASYRDRIRAILQQCEESIAGWALGIFFNMTIITVLSGLGLWLLDVPLAFASALLAGLLTFIPNIGPAISVIPPVATALLASPWKALAVVGLYIGVQQVESNFLTPLVMQKQVSILPAVTLLSQLICAIFFGFLGLLLALPLTVVAQIWLKELWVKPVLDQS
ncbi:AI-2E family transporter [Romeria aff. gracilis LEGE 07310]|uniref:AI-2E family transporter n=1 Tax=Vasconcelosia minhoensis LEGE 07310 TaxID=915328 RepID=A0A8J7AV44_9CYAN|nr:AI-2E family transporter [Romeria gracilis]MBE9076062.1 AI-2E family transporter [Romeria aff. gracilis LEGE 07310]